MAMGDGRRATGERAGERLRIRGGRQPICVLARCQSPARACCSSDDPLTRALAPPPGESPPQRAARLAAEADARRISTSSTRSSTASAPPSARARAPSRSCCWVSQSESGKSTTLKNFQLMNSPRAFRQERLSWRAVVQLNVVRSVRLVLDAAQEQLITPAHLALRARLLPLLRAEAVLLARLMPVAAAAGAALREIENAHAGAGTPRASGDSASASVSVSAKKNGGGAVEAETGTTGTGTTTTTTTTTGGKEVSVFAGSAWKTAFTRMLNNSSRASAEKGGIGEDGIDWSDAHDPTRVLHACGPDLLQLWADERVRALLRRNKLRLEEMPGFFLDSLDRITSLTYLPTDDDILKARLKTLGVTEYRFTMKAGNAVSHDWRVYDVGGQRSLVPAWVPFFDDMNAIIFLAPISCFDQVLMEDNSVNRLEDSVLLWKSVAANPLLAKTNLVLFLNKCDVLRAKLRAGIRLGKYVISYGDRPNDFEHASDYLRRKFYNIHNDHSPEPRQFYSHFTSVTDTKTTSVILENVADMVLRANLKNSQLIG
ncbi:G-alpha-domain-containing protein [Phellopilus nigrolimitatus]|nr:G-alpha-domain-containing protein [Phellopilus nigrolimitatus]